MGKGYEEVWMANKHFRKINIKESENKMTYQFFAIYIVKLERFNKYWQALGKKSTHKAVHA